MESYINTNMHIYIHHLIVRFTIYIEVSDHFVSEPRFEVNP